MMFCLAAVAMAPDLATAATRPAEVPFWQRLLHTLLPGTAQQSEHLARSLRHQRGAPVALNIAPNSSSNTAQPQRSPKEPTKPTGTNPKGLLVAVPLPPSRLKDVSLPTRAAEPAQSESKRAAIPDRHQVGFEIDGTNSPSGPSMPAFVLSASASAVSELPLATSPIIAPPQEVDVDQVGSAIAPVTSVVSPVTDVPFVPLPPRQPRKRLEAVVATLEQGAPPPTSASPEPLVPNAVPDRTKPGARAECNGGQRIVSAYYWEGRHTASGQPFNPRGMTAAHRTLPFGTRLTVTNPRNGQSVSVVVNDRGPFVRGVSLDLTLGAAKAIGMHGTGSVCVL
jgi:hypothetical protein